MFVLFSTKRVMMCPAIDNPASCEIGAVIRFLHAKNMSAAEIHLELCVVYGQHVVSEGTVRQWCKMFEDRRTNFHNEERSGRPFVMSDKLVQRVDQNVCEIRRFTISGLPCEFSQISHTVL
jgi:transposase